MLVGLDIGTSSVKAVAIDRAGGLLKVAERPLDAWWEAAEDVLDECGAHEADGIGLSGQMRGLVALDVDDAPLRPAILGRTDALPWMRANEPELFSRIATVVSPKDFVRLRLTHDLATDVSEASCSGLFDVASREWSLDAVTALELDPRVLPPVYESPAPAGRVAGRVPVAAGAGDEIAAAVGNGVLAPGDPVSIVLGTAAVVVGAFAAPSAVCHALPGRWASLSVTQSAGGSLRWLRDLIDPNASFRRLIAGAEAWDPGSGGLAFTPPPAGGFSGLQPWHDRGALTRAVLEGVAFAVRDSLPPGAERARVSGGGARSEVWLEILAAVLGVPLEVCAVQEGPAFGAALLGGVAAGIWMDVPEAVAECVRVERTVEPREDWVERYAALRPVAVEPAPPKRRRRAPRK